MTSIDYRKLRNLTARKIISALFRDGFNFDRQKGSHQHYVHSDGRRVTVTYTRPGDTFAIGTLQRMIRDEAQWTAQDLKRLKILP
jgi:predicted RNA binding protein YcfA (HicA-like mRNA interferase family)